MPSEADMASFRELGVKDWFRGQAQQIATLQMYDSFYEQGWTRKLARQVRLELAPSIVRAVTVVWYGAVEEASRTKAADAHHSW